MKSNIMNETMKRNSIIFKFFNYDYRYFHYLLSINLTMKNINKKVELGASIESYRKLLT